jgi:hypothetical protein
MKSEWTLLIVPVCKSSCGAQATSRIHILCALEPTWHRQSDSHVPLGVAVTF